MVLVGKSSWEYPGNAGVSQSSIPGTTLFLLYINDLPDDVISYIAICADDTTLYSKCDQASDLWQQLKLASEFESQNQLWIWVGSVLEEKFSFKMLELTFSSKLDWGSHVCAGTPIYSLELLDKLQGLL